MTHDEQQRNENTNTTDLSDKASGDETDSDFDDDTDDDPGLCSDDEVTQKPSTCTAPTFNEDEDDEYQQQQHVTSNEVTQE